MPTQANTETAITKLVRRPEVSARTGLSQSTLYELMGNGSFPRPVKITGSRAVAWIEAEVERWIKDQIIASREAAGAPVNPVNERGIVETINYWADRVAATRHKGGSHPTCDLFVAFLVGAEAALRTLGYENLAEMALSAQKSGSK